MRIAVVGGGIAGLAAARRLEGLLPGVELTLVESEPPFALTMLRELARRLSNYSADG